MTVEYVCVSGCVSVSDEDMRQEVALKDRT